MDRSSTRAASSPSPTRALSAPSTTRRYFPPGRRISSCRPRRADLGTKFAARTISPQTSFPRASSAREFSSNKSSISSSSRKKKAAFHYSRYYFWTTRVRRERERERERIRVSQLVVSPFPSRDLRAQNRCVLDFDSIVDASTIKVSSTPERARENYVSFRTGCSPFWQSVLFPLYSPQKSTDSSQMGSKTRGSQSASSIPSVTQNGEKKTRDTNNREERDTIETQKTYFLTVLLTENAYSPTGSCDRTLIDSRLLLFSSSSFWDTTASSLLVVGAAPTFVPPRTDRDISSSSSSSRACLSPFFVLRAKRVSLSRLCYI